MPKPGHRIRGRKGQELRRRRLAREHLCRHCLEQGRYVASTVPDHILPLYKGGTDTEDNIQCLCEDCHTIKTARDLGYKEVATFTQDGRVEW